MALLMSFGMGQCSAKRICIPKVKSTVDDDERDDGQKEGTPNEVKLLLVRLPRTSSIHSLIKSMLNATRDGGSEAAVIKSSNICNCTT
jgi:hypothetical protein